MKALLIKIAFAASVLTFALSSNQCEPPWGYKPPHDSIVEPPEPPSVLQPAPDTTIWWAPPARPTAKFSWTQIQGAERYELDIDTASDFSTSMNDPYRIIVNPSGPSATVSSFSTEHRSRKYYYRVKAVCVTWRTGATSWSGIRSFVLAYQPGN